MNKISQQKAAYLNCIKQMTNGDLLIEVISSAQGDDYDGCFTSIGHWKFEEARKEIYDRLKSVNFLPQDFKDEIGW